MLGSWLILVQANFVFKPVTLLDCIGTPGTGRNFRNVRHPMLNVFIPPHLAITSSIRDVIHLLRSGAWCTMSVVMYVKAWWNLLWKKPLPYSNPIKETTAWAQAQTCRQVTSTSSKADGAAGGKQQTACNNQLHHSPIVFLEKAPVLCLLRLIVARYEYDEGDDSYGTTSQKPTQQEAASDGDSPRLEWALLLWWR